MEPWRQILAGKLAGAFHYVQISGADSNTDLYTNVIENFDRHLRKVTKTKSAFVSDDALMKILYLATMKIIEKGTMPTRDWLSIFYHLMIYFGDRLVGIV